MGEFDFLDEPRPVKRTVRGYWVKKTRSRSQEISVAGWLLIFLGIIAAAAAGGLISEMIFEARVDRAMNQLVP
jgi:hypothetical protein